LFWVEHAAWVWLLLGVCAVAMLVLRARHLEPTERAMQWPDALGLGLFAASGTQIALDAAMPAVVAVILGVVTAAFGGVLRDIACNRLPSAFSDHRPYALCAFAGGWVLVLAGAAGRPPWRKDVTAGRRHDDAPRAVRDCGGAAGKRAAACGLRERRGRCAGARPAGGRGGGDDRRDACGA
jgi:hypothetical protein